MSELVLPGTGVVQSYDDAIQSAHVLNIPGSVPPIEKSCLEGIPHVITRCVFWMPQKGNGMVSVEAIVAGERALTRLVRRGRVFIDNVKISSLDELPVDPNERVLYNDGGTGIRRQLVKLGQDAKIFDVGHASGKDVMPDEGKLGESRFDLRWTEWKSFKQSTEQGQDSNGAPILVPCIEHLNGNPLLLHVMTGLRKSEYSNETGDTVTWYLG